MKYSKENKFRKHLSIALLLFVYLAVLVYLSRFLI
ncbi:hypothetical protein VSVS12_02877 [Vibrio scophthalmi]|uniref:Uncharacterized protein n=1 Tax=Vibrio scophthalmi TaxID=45658 RepID=A0A1B1NSH1_9VIBR|nr:hypothetical protein VSVS12_02877 [Vibrio scophthalmi]ANU35277.1 hypothetical protein VSVS05_00122 [Vibrio scophthalmi]